MSLLGMQTEIVNWSKSSHSLCYVVQVRDVDGIADALAAARSQHMAVIPRGSGHSYTDAGLNSGGVVIDLSQMRQILSWDPVRGIIRVEPGVTLREMIQRAWKDGWWPPVAPSTPDVTIGGCVAMNVNGRNEWKAGPFGVHVLSLDVIFVTGETCTLKPDRDCQLFNAIVGGLGLLGIITAVTLQLQPIASRYVTVRRQRGASLPEILGLIARDDLDCDFLEAWLDGFATGKQLGRGNVTFTALARDNKEPFSPLSISSEINQVETRALTAAAALWRPVIQPGIHALNLANDWWGRLGQNSKAKKQDLFTFTFWPPLAFSAYHATFTRGVETFQAFVPTAHSEQIFSSVLRYSQQQGCMPLWCIIKRHQHDNSLLSYQVDGFSLELNYQNPRRNAPALQKTLKEMIAIVVEAGGKFYLAKDHFLTRIQYRQSMGNAAVDTFLDLKHNYDPETLLQSDLYRRVFEDDKNHQV